MNITVSEKVQEYPVERLKVGSDTMKYLHDNNCVTVRDAIALLNSMPIDYQRDVKMAIIFKS